MRFFLFAILFSFGLGQAYGQSVPDLGPDVEPPSAEDFNVQPDAAPDDSGGQVVVEEPGPEKDKSRVETLLSELAGSDDPKTAERLAGQIQAIWLESGSDTVNILMRRAGRAIQAQQHALALDLLNTVVILKPSFAEGWNRRATVHYMQEDFGKSLTDIERTLALEPRHWGAMSGLAIIQRRLGYKDEALESFKRVLEIHPGIENAVNAVQELGKQASGEPA